MSKKSMSPSPNRSEVSLGCGYWLFQLILLPSMMHAINGMVSHPLTEAELNFTFFLINFVVVLWIFQHFLKNSAAYILGHPVDFFEGTVLGAVAYALLSILVKRFIHLLDPGFVNYNDASIAALGKGGFYLTLVGTIFLVPVSEECFYRGLLFRSLYKSSRPGAYVVSVSIFALIHIAGYFGHYTPLGLVLSFLQYAAAGLCLAWSYHRSGTIFTPILIHAMVNAYGIYNLR